jgi:hypothetical protein
MREQAKHQRLSAKLFITAENEVSPEHLILNIAKNLSDVGDCDISNLLDPKFYFDLRVGLFDEQGNRYPGSGGEAYTALALLCIGRMSVIQRDKNRTGVRFIIIEELSNIDDTNFGLFPEIAKMFGYQLLTMTPKPFGSYSESEWFLHMLIRGKDKNINYQPMSFFRTKTSKQRLEEYMSNGKIEGLTPLTISASTDEDAAISVKEIPTTLTKVEEAVLRLQEITTSKTSTSEAIDKIESITNTSIQEETPTVVSINTLISEEKTETFGTIGVTPTVMTISEIEETTSFIATDESFVSETSIEETVDVPEPPTASRELTEERKEEFLGLKEDEKEQEKKEQSTDIQGSDEVE